MFVQMNITGGPVDVCRIDAGEMIGVWLEGRRCSGERSCHWLRLCLIIDPRHGGACHRLARRPDSNPKESNYG